MRTVGYIPSETEAAETTNAGGKPPIPEGGGTGTPGRKKNHTPQKTDTGSGTAITATDTADTSETKAVETPSTDHGKED